MRHSLRCNKKTYQFGAVLLSLFLTSGAFWYSFANGYERMKVNPEPAAQAEKIAEQEPITLLFGGDVMLDRYIRTNMRRYGEDFIFQPLAETLQEADAVIVNLEGPITDKASVSEDSRVGEAKKLCFYLRSEQCRSVETQEYQYRQSWKQSYSEFQGRRRAADQEISCRGRH